MPIQVEEEDIPFFAEVIAGGRITIPEEIRKIFGVKDGDHVMCRVSVSCITETMAFGFGISRELRAPNETKMPAVSTANRTP